MSYRRDCGVFSFEEAIEKGGAFVLRKCYFLLMFVDGSLNKLDTDLSDSPLPNGNG